MSKYVRSRRSPGEGLPADVETARGNRDHDRDDYTGAWSASTRQTTAAFLLLLAGAYSVSMLIPASSVAAEVANAREVIFRTVAPPATQERDLPASPQVIALHASPPLTPAPREAARVRSRAHAQTSGTHAQGADGTTSPRPAPLATAAPAEHPEWRRHPLQQDQGLPDGPESPGHEPPSIAGRAVQVRCETTTGPITIEVHLDWAPLGARRFLDMVNEGFFSTKVALFRSVQGFICQTGVAGDRSAHVAWTAKGTIPDDEQWLDQEDKGRMKRGYLSFAGGGPNTRGVEFFFAYRDTSLGDSPWEVPFAKLVGHESFQNMDYWYTGYGDMAAFGGHAPDQGEMYSRGLQYLEHDFPEIDYITACREVQEAMFREVQEVGD